MTTRKELLPGVFLTSIQDGRFKTACFSLSFLRPLRAGEFSTCCTRQLRLARRRAVSAAAEEH